MELIKKRAVAIGMGEVNTDSFRERGFFPGWKYGYAMSLFFTRQGRGDITTTTARHLVGKLEEEERISVLHLEKVIQLVAESIAVVKCFSL